MNKCIHASIKLAITSIKTLPSTDAQLAMADELDDLTDDAELELELGVDKLELLEAIEALLVDKFLDEAELSMISAVEDEELIELDSLEELVAVIELIWLEELLVVLELVATAELLVGCG